MKSIFHIISRDAFVVAESMEQVEKLTPEFFSDKSNPTVIRVSSDRVTVFNWKVDQWEVGMTCIAGIKSMRSINPLVPSTEGRPTVKQVYNRIRVELPLQDISDDPSCHFVNKFLDDHCISCSFHKFCLCQSRMRTRLKSDNKHNASEYDENVFVGCEDSHRPQVEDTTPTS